MTSTRRAFTLIEMLVIIIIIAVMASVAVPSYSRFLARSRFDSLTHDVQNLFAYAREQAVVHDTAVTVSFDPRSQIFIVNVTPPPPNTDQPSALADAESRAQANASPDTSRMLQVGEEFAVPTFSAGGNASGTEPMNGGSKNIHFRGDGTSDGAELALVSDTGYSAHLRLAPATGRLMLEDQ